MVFYLLEIVHNLFHIQYYNLKILMLITVTLHTTKLHALIKIIIHDLSGSLDVKWISQNVMYRTDPIRFQP